MAFLGGEDLVCSIELVDSVVGRNFHRIFRFIHPLAAVFRGASSPTVSSSFSGVDSQMIVAASTEMNCQIQMPHRLHDRQYPGQVLRLCLRCQQVDVSSVSADRDLFLNMTFMYTLFHKKSK